MLGRVNEPPSALPDDVRALVLGMHDAPAVAVVTVTGAGASALAWLLAVPGASRTLLEGRVPYARAAVDELLGAPREDYVSREAAAALARVSRARAMLLMGEPAGARVLGVACTATIATDRPKLGDHRCWVATCDGRTVRATGVVLTKGARERSGEEDVVARLVLSALATAAGVATTLDLRLVPGEELEVETEPA